MDQGAQERFRRICEDFREFGPEESVGIGTLDEKSLHAVLKRYYQPIAYYREVKIGRYVADVVTEDGRILEVQTRSLSAIKKKLEAFLQKYEVILVHPVPHLRWMRTVDGDTGAAGPRRRCGKEGRVWDAFRELSYLHEYLSMPNLKIVLPIVDLDELRLKGARRKARVDRIPIEIYEEFSLGSKEEYWALLPPQLPETFTVNDLAESAKLSPEVARQVLYVMFYAGALIRVGKDGRRYVYRKNTNGILSGDYTEYEEEE